MQPQLIQTIIWDWNGTLLNDLSHCIGCMNKLLKKRNLPLLCQDRYLNVFTFPVRNYYNQLGFDFKKEPFEIPAEEFIVQYNASLSSVPLFEDAKDILSYFKQQGVRQFIVSAMEQKALIQSVKERNILHFFESVKGIDNNLAHGKTAIARAIISEKKIDPSTSLFIGDTLHDAEVAKEIHTPAVLISRGHQHRKRLKKTGNPVLNSLSELLQLFRNGL